MALEYTNQKATSVIPSFGGETDVVVQVFMTCTNPDTHKSMDINVALNMEGFDPSSGFTPFPDVTNEQLTQWTIASAPEYFEMIEQQLS